jgi:16S rRNA (adenine1518-N6/adenine1519-N6)-dimethyltransferase
MELTDVKTIEKLLRKFGTETVKDYGQNFLIDEEILKTLIETSQIEKDDIVLEVGTGIGTVTKELSKKAKFVFSFEIDKGKIPLLKETLSDCQNVKIINEDFLSINLDEFLKQNNIEKYKFVSSLPYNISKKILQNILEAKNKPEIISVIIQKEVAYKYVPSKNKTFLSNYLELLGIGKIIKDFGPESFLPEPKVDSSVLKIVPNQEFERNNEIVRFIKNGFLNPRKKLLNSISNIYKEKDWKEIFKNSNLDENIRAEALKLEDWITLFKNFKSK